MTDFNKNFKKFLLTENEGVETPKDDLTVKESDVSDDDYEYEVNPGLFRYKDEIFELNSRLKQINDKIEQEGPLDEDIADAIDSLAVVYNKINKA